MAKNYFGITDTGKRRTNNEDTFIADKLNKQFITACVIDGLGGYEGGEVAAALAKAAIIKTMSLPAPGFAALLKHAIAAANSSIHQEKEKQPQYNHMACVVTLALADISNNKFYYAHVGDTRLYLLRDHSLVKLTKDQSFVGFLEDNGRITEEEAMLHPKRNEINKALGFDSSISSDDYIEIGDSPFLPGDTLLLCSDGLSDMITSTTIASILNTNESLEKKAATLINAANDAGGNDNITVVLVYNNNQQVKQTAVKPSQKKEDLPAGNGISHVMEQVQKELPAIKSKAVPVLSFLLLCALVAAGWMYYQLHDKKVTVAPAIINTPVIKKRNAAEQLLNDSINLPLSRSVALAGTEGKSITISDTIFITKDSLTLYGNGTVIKSDTAFSGPAFVLAENCRYIVFDSLTFENFNSAILVQQPGLQLRNIRFVNCNIPVIQQYNFPDSKSVTVSIKGNMLYKDSLSKPLP